VVEDAEKAGRTRDTTASRLNGKPFPRARSSPHRCLWARHERCVCRARLAMNHLSAGFRGQACSEGRTDARGPTGRLLGISGSIRRKRMSRETRDAVAAQELDKRKPLPSDKMHLLLVPRRLRRNEEGCVAEESGRTDGQFSAATSQDFSDLRSGTGSLLGGRLPTVILRRRATRSANTMLKRSLFIPAQLFQDKKKHQSAHPAIRTMVKGGRKVHLMFIDQYIPPTWPTTPALTAEHATGRRSVTIHFLPLFPGT